MTSRDAVLRMMPCLDSPEMADARQQELSIPRKKAVELADTVGEAVRKGYYLDSAGERVDWSSLVENARSAKRSISPDCPLPAIGNAQHDETRVQVSNETTLQAARRLIDGGLRPLALNFANGVNPGGGFLIGARAQEENLCRASALYSTILGDPMYRYHQERPRPDASDWVIYSPDVPVFRTDDGTVLDQPWLLSFLTAAAPYAPRIGQPESGDLLKQRIHRVLAVAIAYGHDSLVLGAWGCGAFANDPHLTATDFRHALEFDFAGHFSDVVFAVTDWSPERKYLGPFRDVFS